MEHLIDLQERMRQSLDEIQSRSAFGAEEFFDFLIKKGNNLIELNPQERLEEIQVRGCLSSLFVRLDLDETKHLSIKAYAEAQTVRGYVRLLQEWCQGLPFEFFPQWEALIENFDQELPQNSQQLSSRRHLLIRIYRHLDEQYQKRKKQL